VDNYTAATTNATNMVTATPADDGALVAIDLNSGTAVTNGAAATWTAGTNTLTITVTNGAYTQTYTVVVTKS
jgi:hypothetical protein